MKIKDSNIYSILRTITGLLYVTLGLYFMNMDLMLGNLDPRFQEMAGIVLICYGIYRIVHTEYRKRRLNESEADDINVDR